MHAIWGAVLTALVLFGAAPADAVGPWRLDQALGLPERLSISGDFRIRYEYLDEQFRAGYPGNDQVLALRSRLRVGYRVADWLRVDVEMQDSRVFLDDSDDPINTGLENTAALLQAFAQLNTAGPVAGRSEARLGRLTMDVGSRRLVARSIFRNTASSFTGLEWTWRGAGDREARGFYTLPVVRLPDEADELHDGKYDFDEESFDFQFWGLYYRDRLPWEVLGEVYWFGLHERDADGQPTRNRDFQTPGFRLWRDASAGRWDFEIETALQFGDSRASTSSDRDLDHFAHFHHLSLGYTLDAPCSPRLSLHYDYASGDENPSDGKNGRFDTLFGARRFEYGPTGIYGAFARSNINSPGIRLGLVPAPRWSVYLQLRSFWLAEKRDAWTTAGVRDPSGDSGSYVGSQLDFRIRWDVLPKNLRLETGYAHLFAGRFIDEAPNSNREGDSDYVYAQAQLSF